MKKKPVLIILGVVGIILVAIWVVVIVFAFRTARIFWSTPEATPTILEATLCDEDASNLCVVNFGANNLNRMVINFQLPHEEYPLFYVKVKNRDMVGVYICETDETDPVAVHCTGIRTPLGEAVDLEVYTTDGDSLIARGTFLVSAIAIPTPISLPTEAPPLVTEAPTEEFPTEEPFLTDEPFFPDDSFMTEEPLPYPEDEPTPEFPSSGQ